MMMTIRAHQRFAVRQTIRLRRLLDGWHSSGLMIELSTQGCRISGLGNCDLLLDDQIIVEHDDMKLRGRIRWVREGVAGVRLERLLLSRELSSHLIGLRGREGPAGQTTGSQERATRRRAG